MNQSRLAPFAVLAVLLAAGCSGSANVRGVQDDEYQDYRNKGGEQGKLGGDQGLVFGIGKGAGSKAEEGGALGVNAYLWRGSARHSGVHATGIGGPVRGCDHHRLV